MTEKFEREINGVPYRVIVEGGSNERVVKVMAPSQDPHKQKVAKEYGDDEHFWVFYAKDARETPLGDVGSHVADAVNSAVCKYEEKVNRRSEFRESIDSVLDAVDAVHSDE